MNLKGAYSIKNQSEFNAIVKKNFENINFRAQASEICYNYIQDSAGATETFIAYLKNSNNIG